MMSKRKGLLKYMLKQSFSISKPGETKTRAVRPEQTAGPNIPGRRLRHISEKLTPVDILISYRLYQSFLRLHILKAEAAELEVIFKVIQDKVIIF